MGLSETQIFGFAENVLKLLEKERAALKKGGVDIDAVTATLESLIEVAVAANAAQHDLRRQSKAATGHSDAMSRRLYVTGSGFLDMAIAAVAKDSDAAKDFRRLRSRIDRPRRRTYSRSSRSSAGREWGRRYEAVRRRDHIAGPPIFFRGEGGLEGPCARALGGSYP